MKENKFNTLKREDLLKLCLEMESELEQLRPKPAKFKLGQLVALVAKNPWYTGQPAIFFAVLSVEHRAGEWHYGYAKSGPHNFHVHPERKCRALTPTELDGNPSSSPDVEVSLPQPTTQSTQPNWNTQGAGGWLGSPLTAASVIADFEGNWLLDAPAPEEF
jgi:hypothetical protein